MTIVLWLVQWLLAALFVFAGGMKLILPLDKMTGPVPMPGFLLRFIGVAETLGGLGLILPGLFRVRTGLTPLAAGGLLIVMMGATVLNLVARDVGATLVSVVVGLLLLFVLWGRTRRA